MKPTCGPLPWVSSTRSPRATSSAIGSTARAVTANWFWTVGGSAGSSSELPPIAIRMGTGSGPGAGR
jgi:hypothetical protein